MRLNMQLIQHELKDQLKHNTVDGALNSDFRLANLEYPLLLQSLDSYKENVVYVTSSSQLADIIESVDTKEPNHRFKKPFFCICVGRPPQQLLVDKWCDAIWVESDITRSTLLNEVQELFQYFNGWEWQLEQIVSNYGNAGDLVDASLEIIKNDIWINDKFSRILVHRVYRNIRLSEKQLNEIREGDLMPKQMIDDGNSEEAAGRDFGSTEPVFFRMQAYNTTTLSCAVHAYNNYQMTLAFHPNYQDVSEKDYILMRTLAHYIELSYAKNDVSESGESTTDPRYNLVSILTNKSVSNKHLTAISEILESANKDHEFLLLCCDYSFDRRVYDSCFVRSHVATCNRIQQAYNCLSVPYNNAIVVLINLTLNALDESEFLESFAGVASDNDLAVGTSTTFYRLQEIPGRFLQASIAITKHSMQERIVRFEDHLLEIASDIISETIPPELFAPKELLKLIDFDNMHETELFKTLRVYLDCNCSATQACKDLFIVRSSFMYRLGKIEKIINLDLKNPDVRLLLSLTFRMLESQGLFQRYSKGVDA